MPISCGELNIHIKYILYTISFQILYYCLFGLKFGDLFEEVKIFSFNDKQESFAKHMFIHLIFNHIGILFISLIFLKKEKNLVNKSLKNSLKSSSNSNNGENNQTLRNSQIVLFHNDSYKNKKRNIYFNYLTIIFLWVAVELTMEIYLFALKDLDFWMLELLIITIFNAKMFNLEIYKHQILAQALNAIPCLLKIITIVLSFLSKAEDRLYVREPIWVGIGIVLYFLLITLRSYVNSKLKWFMDLKYISTRNVLICYGIIGTLVYSIVCGVSTFVKCGFGPIMNSNKKNNVNIDICKIYTNSTDDSSNYYFDNFIIYYNNFTFDISLFVEIAVIFSNIIVYFFYKYNLILVIKYLTPVHVIFSFPLLYFVEKIILITQNLIRKGKFINHKYNDFRSIKFYLDSSGDILSLIDFLIYLEIFELNFCHLSYNLRKNIIKRAYIETFDQDNSLFSITNDNTSTSEEDDDDEEEEGTYEKNPSLIVNTI